MRTYVNGLATVWNQQNTEVKVVLSSLMQFSKFNEFMRVCVTRWKAQKAIVPEENNLVTDEELEQLYRETNFSMPHEAQIYNILVMAFHYSIIPLTYGVTTRDDGAHGCRVPCGRDQE